MSGGPRRWPSQLLDRGVSYLERRTADTIIQVDAHYAGSWIDPQRLAQAARLAMIAEPILACRFVEHRLAPYWEEEACDAEPVFRLAESAAAIDAFARETLDPARAPRLRVCAWNAPEGARVVFKVCHHVCDATGVKYVVSLITRFYRRLASQPGFRPVERPSERGIDAILRAIPPARLPALYAQHLQATRKDLTPPQTMAIPPSAPTQLRFVERTLGKDQVGQLHQYAKARGGTLNDLLLTGFVRALAAQSGWEGARRLSVTSTIDYRRYLATPARSVANLSTTLVGFPDLGHELGDDFAATLARVSAITRAGKQGYLGIGALLATLISIAPMRHGLARSIMGEGLRADLIHGRMENGLGNNGPIDPGDVTLEAAPDRARILPSPFYPPQFVVDVSGYAGTLTLILGAFEAQQAAAERFLETMSREFAATA